MSKIMRFKQMSVFTHSKAKASRRFPKAFYLALIHMKALEDSLTGAYNLGTGTGHSVREVIAACERVSGREIPVRESPRRPGDPPILVAGTEKASREIGWAPRFTNLEEIVRTAWEWHEANPDGYLD